MKSRSAARVFAYVAACTTLLSAAGAQVAEARTAGASRGRAALAADASCFNSYGGGIVNSCSGNGKNFEVALEYDWENQDKTIVVSHTPGTRCYAFANDAFSGSSQSPTSNVTNNLSVSWQETTFRIFAPTRGVLIVGCTVASGGRIHRIWWNE